MFFITELCPDLSKTAIKTLAQASTLRVNGVLIDILELVRVCEPNYQKEEIFIINLGKKREIAFLLVDKLNKHCRG